jgi:hypothetical protein
MRKETEQSSGRKKKTKTFAKLTHTHTHTQNCSKTNKASKTAQAREQAKDSQYFYFKKIKNWRRIFAKFLHEKYDFNLLVK